jgi:hypothetical protein
MATDSRFFALLTASVLFVVAAFASSERAYDALPRNSLIPAFPAFIMVMELSHSGKLVAHSRIEYDGVNDWRSIGLPIPGCGLCGDVNVAYLPGPVAPSTPDEVYGPGPWFGTRNLFVSRAESAGTPWTLEAAGDLERLRVTQDYKATEYIFDTATGIPLEMVESVDGRIGAAYRASSVVLVGSGRVIR